MIEVKEALSWRESSIGPSITLWFNNTPVGLIESFLGKYRGSLLDCRTNTLVIRKTFLTFGAAFNSVSNSAKLLYLK